MDPAVVLTDTARRDALRALRAEDQRLHDVSTLSDLGRRDRWNRITAVRDAMQRLSEGAPLPAAARPLLQSLGVGLRHPTTVEIRYAIGGGPVRIWLVACESDRADAERQRQLLASVMPAARFISAAAVSAKA